MLSPGAGPLSEQLLAHAGWIRKLALRLSQDAAGADDLVQETWLAALRIRPDTRWPLRPWLARVLRNQALLRKRRRAARAAREAASARGEALPSAEELALRAEAQRLVVQAVVELEEPYRSLIVLRYYEGLGPEEIARRRGVPAATLRSQLHRAREQLRERLDAEFGGSSRAWIAALAPLAGSRPEDAAAQASGIPGAGFWQLAAGVSIAGVACTWLALTIDWGRDARAVAPALASAGPTAPLSVADAGDRRAREAPAAGLALAEDIRVRLLDQATLEPVAHYTVRVRSPAGGLAQLTSDAAGWLQLPRVPEDGEGAWELELIDDPRLLELQAVVHGREVQARAPRLQMWLEGTADETVFEIPIGPTFALALDLPAGLASTDLRAHIRSQQPNFFTQVWMEHVAPVRASSTARGPWVRFAALQARFLGQDPPWILELTSSDGLWAGAARIEGLRGVQPAPVHVELRPQAKLAGSVLDATGPVSEDVALTLRDARGAVVGLAFDTDLEGRFASGSLTPGKYRLHAKTPRHAPLEVELELRGGEIQRLDLRLQRAAVAGDVEGVLASRSGSYEQPVLLLLESADGGGRHFYGRAAWEGEPGARQAPFVFSDVPRGSYELHLLSLEDQLAWEPARVAFEAPASGLRVECRDDQERVHLAFQPLEAATGALLAECTLVYAAEGGPQIKLRRMRPLQDASDPPRFRWEVYCGGLVWSQRSGAVQIPAIARDRALLWALFAPGCAPRFGDRSDFVPAEGAQLARVSLEAGWGLRLRVREAGSELPVEGAELWADGRVAARSGADGVLQARLARTPAQVDLRCEGRALAESVQLVSPPTHLWLEVAMTRR